MKPIDQYPSSPESHEGPKNPMRVITAVAATALAAGLAVGAAEGYKTYQELHHPHYAVDLDKLVGGSEH